MAEGVIGALILKMGIALATDATHYAESALADETSAMRGLFRGMREMKGELEGLQSFLREAERFRDTDGSIASFMKQTRNIAYQIEDIIDEYTYNMGVRRGGALSKIMKRSRNIKTWRNLAGKLQDLNISLQNITKRRERYDTRGIDKEARPQQARGGLNRAESAHFIKEDDLVGIDKNKELLTKWLEDEQQQCKIISVWGRGSLGKTTLVTQVYNAVKTNFDSCAWVSVSQSYRTDDLLRRIIKEFNREHKEEAKKEKKEAALPNLETMDYMSLVQTIHNYIQDKRYVVRDSDLGYLEKIF
ncbi:disease resistance protein RPM1-like isoform X2 [Typha latifolia]|uniref:disease resistance protein RPM1-like isoform X2 n=1 Tax=Typha latifolia TaxID=4733 RepID=UPI003C2B7C19